MKGEELLGQSPEQWRRSREPDEPHPAGPPGRARRGDADRAPGGRDHPGARKVSRPRGRGPGIAALADTGIGQAEARYGDPPHRFSGGMCQRCVIAAALATSPTLLIADEPTTALDVTIQAQILALLRGLRERSNMTVILITHDMGVIAQMCDRVGVMYAGELVEVANVQEIFAQPGHPYTAALFGAIPSARRHGQPFRRYPGSSRPLETAGRLPLQGALRAPDRAVRRGPALSAISPSQAAACWKRGDFRPTAPPGVAIGAAEGGDRRDLARSPVTGPADGPAGRAREQAVRPPGPARPAGRVVHAVNDVSFSVGRAEVVAIVGETGSGKSTLGNCVSGLLRPTAGQVWFEDNDVAQDRQGRRSQLAGRSSRCSRIRAARLTRAGRSSGRFGSRSTPAGSAPPASAGRRWRR